MGLNRFKLVIGVFLLSQIILGFFYFNRATNEFDVNPSYANDVNATSPPTMLPTKAFKANAFIHNMDYIVNIPSFCTNVSDSLDLMMIIVSGAGNFNQRAAIRATWGSEIMNDYNTTKFAFLLGTDYKESVMNKVLAEAEKYNDIIQADFHDSYRNLTIKTIMLVRWANEFCSNARFLMKVDDDNFMNMKNLITKVEAINDNITSSDLGLYGFLFIDPKPLRFKKSKWYISREQYPNATYPDYVSGTAYVITKPAVKPLYIATQNIPTIFLEDVYLNGLCAKEAGVPRYSLPGIEHRKRKDNWCAYKDGINGHQVTPKNMFKIWSQRNKICQVASKPVPHT